ncbi:peptide ABC transporter substrate-binding protein [Gloeobacter kilaueensis]|uniref:Periplasmic oligopeptide-binding protein n=1 Tax=Gloeobacter kilaueensis (strain ATCC BAA-2537 / CCAP 1431/1 / ULC 316 / JS1) TaxID=1183438 RepID=U5QRA9_GLOK1|nr:peptide ABC transporter substrate-binding protein [Gloeobacter kilaueensis]AGY60189.1 periplasmic oligopeptide-binding protein [Gloeobacter kilaueensis JS1]
MSARWTRRHLLHTGLSGLTLAGCGRVSSAYFGNTLPPERDILRVGNAAEPRSLDPHKVEGALGELNLCMALFDGLSEYHPRTLVPQPALALGWYPENQARRWIFKLRPGVRWNDGTACSAQDFVYSWRRALDPATGCPYANLLYYLKNGRAINEGKLPTAALGVSAPDPLTLRVEMEGPVAFFPLITSFFIFRPVPEQAIVAHGDEWTRPGKLVTNGAFTLAHHRPYDEIRLLRSPTYWDRSNVRLAEAVLLPIVEGAQNVNLYLTGELDVTVGGVLPRPLLPELRRYRDFRADGRFITYYLSFNCSRSPFDRSAVRTLLGSAIERDELARRYLKGDAVAATSFIPPGIPGYTSPGSAPASPPRRSFLERFTIHCANREPDRTVAAVLQSRWKQQLGAAPQVSTEELQTFLARIRRHDYDVAVTRWGGDYLDPTTFLDLYDGLAPKNYPGWDDSLYRQLLAVARREGDPQQRYHLLARAEARLLAEAPIWPLFHTGLEYLQKPWLTGWEPNLQDLHPLKYVAIDRSWHSPFNASSG